jgi:hypothetical protein
MDFGVYVNGKRPKTKAAVKNALASDPASVTWDVTSAFNNGPSRYSTVNVPSGTHYFVGPDPYTSRKFYGQLIVGPDGSVRVK